MIYILVSIAMLVFFVWYLPKILDIEQERNEILKDISAKLDKKDKWQENLFLKPQNNDSW
jgi:hypothetical protein